MRVFSNILFYFCLTALVSACARNLELFSSVDDPIRLEQITPSSYLVSVGDGILFQFSQRLTLPKRNAVFVIAKEHDQESLRQAILAGKLTAAQKGMLIDASLSMEDDGRNVRVTTRAIPSQIESIVVLFSGEIRGETGKALRSASDVQKPLAVTFSLEKALPRLLWHDFKSDDGNSIGKDRRIFHLQFSRPLQRDEVDSIQIICDGKPDEAINFTREQSADGMRLRLEVGAGFDNSRACTVEGIDRIVFLLEEESPKISAQSTMKITALGEDDSVVFRSDVKMSGTLWVWFGEVSDRKLDCLGNRCPISLDTMIDQKEWRIIGLSPQTEYRYRIAYEDNNGAWNSSEGLVRTEYLAKIQITEVMAYPLRSSNHSSDKEGEYIELYNPSEEAIRLDLLQLAFVDAGKEKTCAVGNAQQKNFIAPGEYLILVGKDFQEIFYPNLPASSIFRVPRVWLCGAIKDDGSQVIRLKDKEGRTLSTFSVGQEMANKTRGRSIEKQVLENGEIGYCMSSESKGPTPGAENHCKN